MTAAPSERVSTATREAKRVQPQRQKTFQARNSTLAAWLSLENQQALRRRAGKQPVGKPVAGAPPGGKRKPPAVGGGHDDAIPVPNFVVHKLPRRGQGDVFPAQLN